MSTVVTVVGKGAIDLARTISNEIAVLAEDAADIFVDGEVTTQHMELLTSAKVDVFIQPVAGRQKRVLLADMESTLIENEFLDDIAEHLGIAAQVKQITQRGMEGGISFEESLRQRLLLLKDAPVQVLQDVLAGYRPSKGVQQMMAMLHAAGIPVWLVSSGFTFFTEPVGTALGCVVQPANVFDVQNGRLTGKLLPPIKDKHAKRAALDAACQQYGITPAEVAAIGDGANDLLMLRAAGTSFGYHAKPVVAAACRFTIQHSDLRAVAFAFGLQQQ